MAPPEEPKPRKAVDDPIDPAIMREFTNLRRTRQALANRLLELREEEINVIEAARQAEVQKIRLFEQVLAERGLPPSTAAEIDASTSRLHIVPQTAPVRVPNRKPKEPPPGAPEPTEPVEPPQEGG